METKKYIAKTLFGLEEVLANEISSLGGKNIQSRNRSVSFEADLMSLYRINLASRLAIKILYPIKKFSAKNPEQLYRKSIDFYWAKLISSNDTFLVDSVVNSKNFKHSKYAALKLKDAIVDQIRRETGKRPNINLVDPTFKIHLHIDDDNCTISLDSSGESLHKRGYRLSGEQAPLNEILAAGMIILSNWDGNSNFVDPMCGSGTLAIEAALLGLRIPPNLDRENFGFMNWKSFDKGILKTIKDELISNRRIFKHNIICNDINPMAINSAKANAKRAGVESVISFNNEDFSDFKYGMESGTLIVNPPYGERLKPENVRELYKAMGDTFKQNYEGFDAWVLSSNKEALKNIGLRTSKRLMLFNGSLECKYHNYKLYKGSMKKKYE